MADSEPATGSFQKDSQVVHRIARLAWITPAIMLFLSVNQAFVAVDIFRTLEGGTPAMAEVVEYERVDRADVTYGYVSLSVTMEDGSTLVKEKMSLPYTLLPRIEGKNELPVVVSPGADQEIVISSIADTQWKIAAIQSAVAFVGFLIFGTGIYLWNRNLARQRDSSIYERPSV